jgi:hypothetical protein
MGQPTADSCAATKSHAYVREAYAAGKLSILGPLGVRQTSTVLVNEWAAKEKVETQIDYITSQGFKILLTASAEGKAKTGQERARISMMA